MRIKTRLPYRTPAGRGMLFGLSLLASVVLPCAAAFAQISAFEDPIGGGGNSNTEFVPRRDEFDGGEVGQSQTAQVVTLFRNATSAALTISKVQLVPSSNVTATIGNDQCSAEPIKPGVECAITVRLTGQSNGKFRVGMLISHSGKTRLTNAVIAGTVGEGKGSGSGGLQSEIEGFPADLDFGQVSTPVPLVRSLALRNSTGQPVTVETIELAASPSSGFSVSAPKCKKLNPAQSCVATVTWTPRLSGLSEGVIVLRHSGPSGAMRVGLKGQYDPKKAEIVSRFATAVPGMGLLIADQDKIDFGSEVDGAASISVSLINDGDSPLEFREVKLAGSDNGLTLSNNDCKRGKKLDSGQACVLTINWQPRRIGPVIDDVQILHTGARNVLVLPVRGSAQQPVSGNSGPLISYDGKIPDMPKLKSGKLDESVLKAAGIDDMVTPRPSVAERNKALNADNSGAQSLDGFRISSVGNDHAIIAGPKGRLIVKNNEPQVIGGVAWTPHIVQEGVELTSGSKTILLLFDRSLAVMQSMGVTSGGLGTYGTAVGTTPNVNSLSGVAVTATPAVGGAIGGAAGGMGVGGAANAPLR